MTEPGPGRRAPATGDGGPHADRPDSARGRSGRPGRDDLTRRPRLSRFLLWASLLALMFVVADGGFGSGDDADRLPYTAFRTQTEEGNVVSVRIRGREVRGVLGEPVARVEGGDTVRVTQFVTHVPAFGDDALLKLLEARGVDVWTLPEHDGSWLELLLWGALPILLFGALFLVLMRRMAGNARSLLSIGRSGARRYEGEESHTTLDDVAGAAAAKSEFQEIVSFLRDPARFHRLGAEVPTGVLLVGPPGTGKTLLARAVAGEADVAFFTITGSDFMEMFVGVGARRVRDLFEKARAEAPSIVFIDELDSIGRHRGAGLGGGHDEREQTLNQLLSALDGFEPAENVVVMAATNRPDILDPALLRPGRFDRRICVDLPTASERLEVLGLHTRTLILSEDIDMEPLARSTPGFSGADLKNLLNEAALAAAREDAERIEPRHVELARDRVLLGLEREGLVLTDDEIRTLAHHEAGHALLAAVLPHADPVHKVTIVPRGRSMGSTHQLPDRDRYVWREDELLDRLTLMLGGRAAEELLHGGGTSGAENDLRAATRLARRMVLRWGMSPALGPFSAGSSDEEVFLGEQLARRKDHSEATWEEADREVRRILGRARERALDLLEERRDVLEELAQALIRREELTGAEVEEIVAGVRPRVATA